MSAKIGMIFDILVLLALAVSVWRAATLSRQVSRMQADQKAFEQLIQALNLAASRAEAAIRALKETAIASSHDLQDKTSRAKALSEELEIMVQAGDNLAERLNTLAEQGRKASGAPFEETPAKAPGAPRSRAEKELAEALKTKQS